MASPAFSAALDPITGFEDLRDLTHPRHALTQFYRAFNTRDIVLMRQNWSPFDDISMNNPIGGIKRGWPEIRRVYERLFTGPARITVEFHQYSLHVSGEIFCAVGRERGRFESSTAIFDLAFRTTRIFRLLDHHWRQVHHHGSIDDPTLLDRYQSFLNSLSHDAFLVPSPPPPLLTTPRPAVAQALLPVLLVSPRRGGALFTLSFEGLRPMSSAITES